MKGFVRSLAGGLWLLNASSAFASSSSVTVEVQHANDVRGCPSSEALTARLLQIRPANEAAAEGAQPVHVNVRFERVGTRFSASLRFSGARSGERRIEEQGNSCAGIAEAAAVAIALALDREDARHAEERSEASASETLPAQPERAPPSRPEPSPRSVVSANERGEQRPWQLGLVLASGAGVAFGAPVALLLGGRIQVTRGALQVELGVGSVLPGRVSAGEGHVETSFLFADAAICGRVGRSYSLAACGAFAWGRAYGQGIGFAEDRAVSLTWAAAGPRVGFALPLLGAWSWSTSASLWVPLRKLSFSVENGGVAWRSSPVCVGLDTGVGIRFH